MTAACRGRLPGTGQRATRGFGSIGLSWLTRGDSKEFTFQGRWPWCRGAPLRPIENARDGALMKQNDAVAQSFDGFGDMTREQHRRSCGRERPQFVLGLQGPSRVEAIERLVTQKHRWPMEHGRDER